MQDPENPEESKSSFSIVFTQNEKMQKKIEEISESEENTKEEKENNWDRITRDWEIREMRDDKPIN